MSPDFRRLLLSGILVTAAAAQPVNWPLVRPQAGDNPALVATPRNDWMEKFAANLARGAQGEIDLLFEGDSITERWRHEAAGRAVWDRYYGRMPAATFGIGGDRTENVLWRIRQGQLDGLKPRLVVLMIGTNNSGRDSAEQIAAGIAAILQEIRARCPDAHLLLMGILPRAERSDHPLRLKVAEVNHRIARLAADDHVTFLDVGPAFLRADGTMPRELMPDFLHPSERGYEIWAEALRPLILRHVVR